jgi:hypothetical protein
MRWALLLLLIGGLGTAEAQVFKPKGKAPVSDKKPARPAAKKSTKTTKKKSPTKKSAAADRGRPADLTPDSGSRESDSDFVKITDDDEIE